jgi:hypothetical protein
MLGQILNPSVEVRVRYSEADMLQSASAVSWNIAVFQCFIGIEQEQHGMAAAKEDVTWNFRGEKFESEDITIERRSGFEVIHVKGGFENTLNVHAATEAANRAAIHG